jgi:NADPH2 dehydrogenase/N-ethylmaleimide reductase
VTTLFDPLQLGALTLANRIVMAPMTRNRAEADGCANALMAEYYAQRASAGLIVAEGAWPTADGQAYCRQPGIATAAHVQAWRGVTDAVHRNGGTIALQIMHAGRIGSHCIKPAGVRTLAPSSVPASGSVWTDRAGMQPFDLPHAMTAAEVCEAVDQHGHAARRARDAGFDAVELHGTSGYLTMQFLYSGTNRRSDAWGGDAAGRCRFAVACLQSMADAIGADRVGLRVNPGNRYNDAEDADSAATHAELLRQVQPLGLAWLHVMRAADPATDAFGLARRHFGVPLILNDGFDAASAAGVLAEGLGEAVSFARSFIGNPDLVHRIRAGLPIAPFDRRSLYTPGAAGYTDYPACRA